MTRRLRPEEKVRNFRRAGETETLIFRAFLDRPPMTVPQVHEILHEPGGLVETAGGNPIAQTSVRTTLYRLEKAGALQRTGVVGKSILWTVKSRGWSFTGEGGPVLSACALEAAWRLPVFRDEMRARSTGTGGM